MYWFILLPIIAVWIYLVFMVWKKKTNIFHDQMEPELAERRYKMLKAFLLVAGISFVVGFAGLIVGSVLSDLSEIQEPVSHYITLVVFWVFVIVTIGGLVMSLIGRRKTT